MMGRNDLCWCLSGKKYKKCHLGRENETPYRFDELVNIAAQLEKSLKGCVHPRKDECNGQIISAHSIQRAKSLEKIANDRYKIYECSPRYAPFEHAKREHLWNPVLIHINRASTFYGFCSYHDNKLFIDIENHDFDIYSKCNSFLIAYKCLCYEMRIKELGIRVKEHTRQWLDKGMDYKTQVHTQAFSLGYIERTKFDLSYLGCIKKNYDDMLLKDCYDDINYLAMSFEKIPDIMCTGCIALAYDFSGNFVQKENLQCLIVNEDVFPINISIYPMYLHNELHYIQFSLFSTENLNIALFVWHKKSASVYDDVMASLLNISVNRISDALLAMSLLKLDNVYMRQSFWDNLSEIKKSQLRVFIDRISLSNCLRGIEIYLKDEKPYFADWMPKLIYSNVGELNSLSKLQAS